MGWHRPETTDDWPWPVWERDTFDKPHEPGFDWAKLLVFGLMAFVTVAFWVIVLAALWALIG